MAEPEILQIGPCPDRDRQLLEEAFRPRPAARCKAMGKLVRDNLSAHFAGQPLLTPVL